MTRIKEALRLRGWTQRKLANRLGVHYSYVCLAASGKRRDKRFRKRIAHALNADPAWLFPGQAQAPTVSTDVKLPLKGVAASEEIEKEKARSEDQSAGPGRGVSTNVVQTSISKSA